jgi:hypothetical protein
LRESALVLLLLGSARVFFLALLLFPSSFSYPTPPYLLLSSFPFSLSSTLCFAGLLVYSVRKMTIRRSRLSLSSQRVRNLYDPRAATVTVSGTAKSGVVVFRPSRQKSTLKLLTRDTWIDFGSTCSSMVLPKRLFSTLILFRRGKFPFDEYRLGVW